MRCLNQVSAAWWGGGESFRSSSGESVRPDWRGAPGWTIRGWGDSYARSPDGRQATTPPAPRAMVVTTAGITMRRDNTTQVPYPTTTPGGETAVAAGHRIDALTWVAKSVRGRAGPAAPRRFQIPVGHA